MQLTYRITNLSDYTKKVKQDNWIFPDFSDHCPICRKKNCAVRIGYYRRWVFVFALMAKLHIPIARYLCRKTGRTFSLLPSQCIPYMLYDVDSLMFMADMRFERDVDLLDIATEFSALSDMVSVSPATVFKYLLIFIIAHNKMMTLLKLQHDSCGQWADHIISFTGGTAAYVEDIYRKYALFLFGTPSQLR